jgi:hypothetical protein
MPIKKHTLSWSSPTKKKSCAELNVISHSIGGTILFWIGNGHFGGTGWSTKEPRFIMVIHLGLKHVETMP